MYNFYLDYLKSFKRFISTVFPDIKHYQFNYSDKAFLNYKLYQEHVKEYPMCIISMTDITTDDNKDFFRYIGKRSTVDTAQLLASNHTKEDSIIMDFKWVTIQMQVKINLYGTADILNYHNMLISNFPKNFMFYSYKYGAYIHIDNYVDNWEVTDDTEGLFYRTNEQAIEAFALYDIEPIFKMNSITKNKIVDGETSLDINLEVRLKVPNVVGNMTLNDQIVNGIQIVMHNSSPGGDKDLPILIDMNNDVFSDRQQKLERGYFLTSDNFDIENNQCLVPIEWHDGIINKAAGIYMVDDSTEDKPVVLWTEIELIKDSHVVDGQFIFDLDDSITTFQFNEMNHLQLLVFD